MAPRSATIDPPPLDVDDNENQEEIEDEVHVAQDKEQEHSDEHARVLLLHAFLNFWSVICVINDISVNLPSGVQYLATSPHGNLDPLPLLISKPTSIISIIYFLGKVLSHQINKTDLQIDDDPVLVIDHEGSGRLAVREVRE